MTLVGTLSEPNLLIKKLELYTRLSCREKAVLERLSAGPVRLYQPRESIIRQGEPPEVVNLFRQGWACRFKDLPNGRRQVVSFLLPGDLCDLNVFVLRQMDHSIEAITAVSVAQIARAEFEMITAEYPRITQALWWDALVTNAIQREWTTNIGQRDAGARVGHLLCELFIRLRAVGLTTGSSCAFPLTQALISEATGLTNVHVNRTIQRLRTLGLVSIKERRLAIPDLEALMEFSMFETNYLHLDHEGRHLDAND